MLTGKGQRAQAVGQALTADAIGEVQERLRHARGVGEAVGDLLGQDVLDRDQQLASDGDEGLGLAQMRGQARELGDPMWTTAHGTACGFNHHIAQVATAGFDDAALRVRLPTVVHATAQTGLADQVGRVLEAGDVADGGQQRDSAEQANARQLHHQRHACVVQRDRLHRFGQAGDLLLGKLPRVQIAEQIDALHVGERHVEPPVALRDTALIALLLCTGIAKPRRAR